MRSRYTAYTLQNMAYIRETWHQDYCPATLQAHPDQRWLGLRVLDFVDDDDRATVCFEARYLSAGRVDGIHESSRFIRQAGRWWYTDGELLPLSFVPWKPGRNEDCPCGSGRKFKRCCGV